jgi:hypothetical protein
MCIRPAKNEYISQVILKIICGKGTPPKHLRTTYQSCPEPLMISISGQCRRISACLSGVQAKPNRTIA